MTDLRNYARGDAQSLQSLASCNAGETVHTIRRGETLNDIARAYGVTLNELMAANPNLDPYQYRAGMAICIPNPSVNACCAGRLYCVRDGDTTQSVAEMFGLTLQELIEANPILAQIGMIPGQIICIPFQPLPMCPPGTEAQITVQQNQTVTDILLLYQISYSALQRLNPDVDLQTLVPGQVLCIPPAGTRGTCIECESTYVIQAGEDLAAVSQRTGVSPEVLMRLNPTFLDTDFSEGMMICLP